MASLRSAFVPLLLGLFTFAATVGDEPVRKVPGFGELYNPDKDCDVGLAGTGKLTITVPGKAHDFAADLQRWNAPHILSPVQADFIAEVKVGGEFKPGETSTIAGRRPYHGAGLLLVKDRNNYVSLHRGAVYLDNRVRHYANFELRKDGDLAISRYEVELEDRDTYLRVERRGNKFFALASHDGVQWKVYEEPIDVAFPPQLRVGVVAVSSSDQPFRCTLEGLAIFRKTTPQTRQP